MRGGPCDVPRAIVRPIAGQVADWLRTTPDAGKGGSLYRERTGGAHMPEPTIAVLDGSTFVVSDRHGDIDARPDQAQGFFFRDTRHLSRWRLTMNGVVPDVLSTDNLEYYFAQFFLAPATGTIYENPYV